jgi:murein DD-endopeptidase MepM/ murein hydrolase activator NlpD
MSVDVSRPSIVGPAVTLPVGEGPAVAPNSSVEQIAQEFEAMLMAQMVRQMRQSFLSEEEHDEGMGLGLQTMTETIDVELARALSRAGGIGLADEIQRSMMRAGAPGMATPAQPVPAVTESPSGPVAQPTRDPAAGASMALADGALRMPLATAASSAFGWRGDPFHGQRRFHAGIDLKGAYGQEVPTAGAGRVTFAGDHGAYGLTVVVEHPNGVQTRYAHLSSLSVQAGQEIADGTAVGRLGQTGRATGPHLHFEVLVNGRRVDPARLAQATPPGTASLKLPAMGDD